MREITKLMINEFNIEKLGYDMMGYTFKNIHELSFHHLIIPKRLCYHLEDRGYTRDNGAILNQSSSHNYLHTIEIYDRDKFLEITKYLVEENKMGKIDIEIIKEIRDILIEFENQCGDIIKLNGSSIIKKEYKNRINL